MQITQPSSDEQPTQELDLNSYASTLDSNEQLPVDEKDTMVLVIAVEQAEGAIQHETAANQEQQETLPLVSLQATLQQPAVGLSATEHKAASDNRSLTGKNKQANRLDTLLLWIPLLLFVLLFISMISFRSEIPFLISHQVERFQPSSHVTTVLHPKPSPTQLSPIESASNRFMHAMLSKDWTSMWLMLSPDAQRLWQGENDFIHFEQAKFGSLELTSYTSSAAYRYDSWLDPDTTQVYSNVAILHVSLNATAPLGVLSPPSNLALGHGLFMNTLFALVYAQPNWQVLVAGPADLDAPILVPASPPTTKLLVPIFMYHHVSDLPVSNYLDYGLTVTTVNFNAQLDWLQQQGYQSINQTELFDALYFGKALPKHPMILTFDDGYEDVYTNALPALLAHHFRGVFYIITGMIGGGYMTWPQVRILAQNGMQVSSHTIHHVNIGQPPSWTTTQNELLVSKQTLEAQLKQPVQFFCYPTGEPFHLDSVYEQQIVLADLYKDGYVSATLDPFYYDSAIQNAQTPYQLPRIRVSGGESLDLFINILNSTLDIGAYRMANGYPY
jgi:peptidoglycan/xylan/chitin deacetylase (PgdA/CDA1 family)